jgi:hypothetical protein
MSAYTPNDDLLLRRLREAATTFRDHRRDYFAEHVGDEAGWKANLLAEARTAIRRINYEVSGIMDHLATVETTELEEFVLELRMLSAAGHLDRIAAQMPQG